ncbi:MAG: hypothetical protein ACYTBV_07360 [Planctomycetota bacterium]
MKDKDVTICCESRSGAALLVVLFVVMAATILALGFLSRSNSDLLTGNNMILRAQMDYLAESGLEHARGLLLNPQDITGEYWTGATRQQLVAGSEDYYDIQVTKLGQSNYQILCEAYRERNGVKIGRCALQSELRLDPCAGIITAGAWVSEPLTTINGDVICGGNLGRYEVGADINGDAYAFGTITAASVEGRINENTVGPVAFPGISVNSFNGSYYIGTNSYVVRTIDVNSLGSVTYSTTAGNPSGVCYYDSNSPLYLDGNVNITGTLVVNGNLRVRGTGNVITAVKNFPAIVVNGELIMETSGQLTVNGLAQVGQRVSVEGANADVDIIGALVIVTGAIEGAYTNGARIDVTVSCDNASIEIWPNSGNSLRWSPAVGGFFRSVARY